MCDVEQPELTPKRDAIGYVQPALGHRDTAGHEADLRVDLGVHRDRQRIAVRVLGQAGKVGASIQGVRDAGVRCRARILAVAGGPVQPVRGAADMAPDQHVGGVRRQERSRRRLEEAVARRELAGTDEVEQLRDRLPVRVGDIHGHRHRSRIVRHLGDAVVVRSLDVEADALQPVAELIGTGREALRQHRVRGVGCRKAVGRLAQVLHHRVERLAEEGHVWVV